MYNFLFFVLLVHWFVELTEEAMWSYLFTKTSSYSLKWKEFYWREH